MGILFFLNIGGSELILVILVILILFGGKGLPSIAKTLGRAMREFKDAASGVEREIYNASEGAGNVVKEVEEKINEIRKELPKTD
ncbi:MAG: twin-arginine translocase TatA/TatE family subunit [Bacteroidia bacterium]|nr:twin-arginine translocase TatA/TatE family subunit [Bacteroidia bacterium]